MVDLDQYITHNRSGWDRLAELTRAAQSRQGLRSHEVDELVGLYERTSGQLSYSQNRFSDPTLTLELNTLVARAHAAIYRKTSSNRASIRRFFTAHFPAAFWHLRYQIVAATLVFVVPAVVSALWLASNEQALDLAISAQERAELVDHDFEAYYSSEPASQFAAEVQLNNIQVSFLAFAGGVLMGLGAVFVLILNGLNLGVVWAVFIDAGQQEHFWGLILPHGLLELTAVFVAGGAGLNLAWSLIAPGDRTRGVAFGEAARRSGVVVIGLVLCFLAAGFIEAFVTPSSLPTAARIMIGLAAEAAFLTYVVVLGRSAARNGLTGLLSEELEGDTAQAIMQY